MQYTSSRLAPVEPSASVEVSQAARQLKSKGIDVIDLGLGEPDFDTPPHIVEAAHRAALSGQTRYTPMAGTIALKQAVLEKFRRDNDLEYDMSEIICSNGAKQIIFMAMMASLEPGDEVLILAPYFGVYKDIVLILGGKPVKIDCKPEDGFRLTPEELSRSISEPTRWLILNLPSNPAGVTYSQSELRALGDVLENHSRILILSDEIYEHILFDNQTFFSFAKACPNLSARTLTVNGVSKAYAMTGWRIGYAGGPKALIAGMTKVQSQISSAPCSIAQAAATAALTGPQNAVEDFRQAYEKRRNLVVNSVADIPGLKLAPPGGAFYALIDCVAYIGSTSPNGKLIKTDVDFAEVLLQEAHVAVVPGAAYGMSPFFRISTASSETQLANAMSRISKCLSNCSNSK